MLLTAALALGLAGPGAYSLDAALGIQLPAPTLAIGLALVLVSAVVALTTRAPAADELAPAAETRVKAA